MPQMITYGSELIRINPSNNRIEFSTSNGRTWLTRFSGSSCGRFVDLLEYGNEIIALTDKGVYFSTSSGRTWLARCTSSDARKFTCLQDGGRELLAMTSDGHLYFSTSSGRTWLRRR